MMDDRKRARTITMLLAAILLLAAFMIIIPDLAKQSLTHDEGWTMWAIRESLPTTTVVRVADDVHPPLYFLLVDVWAMLTGESAFTIRLLSALFALIGLAATYTIGRQLFDRWAGLFALTILMTASFFVYYAREARMYSLLLALGALTTATYLHWLHRPTRTNNIRYALAMALLMYTHYVGVFIIATHLLHLLLTQPYRLRKPLPYIAALTMYVPWLPVIIHQIRIHPDGSLAPPLSTDVNTLAALLLVMTSARWGLLLLPFVIGRGLLRLHDYRREMALIVLWLVVTPAGLLLANLVFPIYQQRYTIAILPAGALFVGYGLRHISPRYIDLRGRVLPLGAIVAVVLTAWIANTQLRMFYYFWFDKPPWQPVITQMIDTRHPTEPTITNFADSSVVAYYNRQFDIQQGITIDLAWRSWTPDEIRDLMRVFDATPSVWTVMRWDAPETWDTLAHLNATHTVGYRDSVQNILFYRFDQIGDDVSPLQFRFGDVLALDTGIGHQLFARLGESFCFHVPMIAQADVDDAYDAVVYLTQGYHTVRAAWRGAIGTHTQGDAFTLSPCIDIAPDSPRGPYHIRLAIERRGTAERLPLLEGPPHESRFWGYAFIMGVVSVDE